MRRSLVILASSLAVLAAPAPASAWGFEVHRFITAKAIALLPPEIRPFFERFETAIVEHSIDPDLWRNAGFEDEPPRHFVDMDAYGPPPFTELPREYDDAVRRYGRAFVEKNGLLPWRAEEIYRKLVEGFTLKSPYARENIKFFASVTSHYVADGHVPFHAAVNYDGQLTGQRGIHSRFESELFERLRNRLTVRPTPIVPVRGVRDFMFDVLLSSFPHVEAILEADRAAAAGREAYDDGYFTMFASRVQPIMEARLSAAMTHVASVIAAAWEEAGRPALPVETVRTPAPVRRR